jgi:hypothetical protein
MTPVQAVRTRANENWERAQVGYPQSVSKKPNDNHIDNHLHIIVDLIRARPRVLWLFSRLSGTVAMRSS